MLKKLCLRDIRSSLGRFFAIAAIIALGVGLFAGLRVSRDAMVQTGGQYLQDFKLYDFRLLSTLGFTAADAEAFSKLPGIREARGSLSQDVLYQTEDGSDLVIAIHTLLPDLNVPDLRAGRMPVSSDECVLDAAAFGEDALGTWLTLSASNDTDTLQLFSHRAYRVVGLADSPIYINFERGSTTLGSGSVSCFGYLLPEGFDADYCTELYLTLENSAPAYSDAYDKLAEEARPKVEALLSSRAALRYQTLRAEGGDKLSDARAELEDAREQYENGKREAEESLAAAWDQLEDARRSLDDGWAELENGRTALDAETASAEAELAEAQRALEDARAELESGEAAYLEAGQELERGEAEYAEGLQEYENGLAAYEDGKLRCDRGRADYEAGYAEYQDGMDAYRSGRERYNRGVEEYEKGRQAYETQRALFESQVPDIEAVRTAVEENREQAEAAREPLNALLTLLLSQLSDPGIRDTAALTEALRSDETGTLTAAADHILSQLSQLDPAVPADTASLLAVCSMLEQYDQGVAALAAYDQLENTRILLEETSGQLSSASAALSDARAELNSAKKQLEEARNELEEAESQLEDAWAELEAGQAELDDARGELDDGWRQYQESRAKLDDGWQEYQDGCRDLENGRQTLEEETASARQRLADAEAELRTGETEYADGLNDYQTAEYDAQRELEDAAAQIAEGEQALKDGEAELAGLEPADCYTLGRETNVGYICFENDTNIVSSVAKVFPLFFFLVAALVCITTMTRMVEDARTKIGVLQALGYSGGAIMASYLFYAGSASLLGCSVGFLAGSWGFPVIMWKVYDIMYSFSYPIQFVLDWKLAAFSIGLYMFCALGSTWLVCRSSLRESAAELIRPKAPKCGKRILLEHVTVLWRRIPFLYKVSIRNIFRYQKRLFMMVLGIGGCTALLLTGFGIRDSIANIVEFQFQEISHYDSAVTFRHAMSQSERTEFLEYCSPWTEQAVFFYGATVDVSAGGVTKSANLAAAGQEMADVIDFHAGDVPVSYPERGGVLINNGLAEALGVSVGDLLTLRSSDMQAVQLPISGVFDNYFYHYVFLTPETFADWQGVFPEAQSAYLRNLPGTDPHAAGAALSGLSSVASVSVNADTEERVGAMLGSLNYIVLLVILCAGCLAFIVLYNLTNINITERIREIATIKVLGFYPSETAAYVFRENTILTAVGAAAGIVLGRYLHAYVMSQIRIDMMHFDVRIEWPSYLLSFALTFLFAAVVNLAMLFRLERINMAESLKSIE